MPESPNIAIIGGGPAGLRAAEACAAGGAKVTVFEGKRSVGRKLLVAGYGGLNITHGEDLDQFVTRYSGPGMPAEHFARIIRSFSPTDLRNWAAQLGIETFEQRTGRVYPKEMKAAPLLRRWVERLRKQGVLFQVNHTLTSLDANEQVTLQFNHGDPLVFDAAILALGGASWSKTGSDGKWTSLLQSHGIVITPLQPANCGWEVDWPAELVGRIEGQPMKNLAVSAGPIRIQGELMPTRYGFEGGAIYQLGPFLREMPAPVIEIDLKPEVPLEGLLRKMESVRKDFLDNACERLKLTRHAALILDHVAGPFDNVDTLCRAVKGLVIPLTRPRPIDEAISSAGGIAWSELDDSLQLRRLPGVYACGEMIDWEAPTGGYLIQGCFATATHAARGALKLADQE
ncbi:NAD(P)/FAD-dependent oxidoreductase [Haloferula rosea]|uniref:TIGR03862 family flavoprotein n=1 Tax=Haloferula rosea TaxID=490093 RepID=A0A934VFH8_9BACT|nr:TIGR03862 family flavoprotein [Haloferula rosea]MBK1827012.1 TIGR03862 family flavoprotein [Haloferula rosea]